MAIVNSRLEEFKEYRSSLWEKILLKENFKTKFGLSMMSGMQIFVLISHINVFYHMNGDSFYG